MGFLDKVKNMFIEELDDEDVIKKEVIQVKIPQPEEPKVKMVEEEEKEEVKVSPRVYEEDLEDETEEEVVYTRPEPEISYKKVETIEPIKQTLPKYFDDEDFEMGNARYEEPAVVKKEYTYTRTETTVVTPNITGYGVKKEGAKKTFTPTPIISPVYGVLNKNYRKDEITTKKRPRTIYSEFDKVSVEDIRKKAYGTLEDELESTLSHETYIYDEKADEIIDDSLNYSEQPIDIFGELERKDALDDFLSDFATPDDFYKDDTESGALIEDELNKDYDKYEAEMTKSRTKEFSESDLFNLIDSMYSKRDGE